MVNSYWMNQLESQWKKTPQSHAIKTLSNRESQATVKKNSNGSSKSTLVQQNQNQISVSSQNMFKCILCELPAMLTPYHSPDKQYTQENCILLLQSNSLIDLLLINLHTRIKFCYP